MTPKNVYASISAHLEAEYFDVLLENRDVKIERIVSKGYRSPETGWYDQDKNEWVLLLKGRATLTFDDDKTVHLNEGDYLHIPAHQKHKVSWTDPEQETYWLAVHY